jgi:cholesterol transport system auxiliary component
MRARFVLFALLLPWVAGCNFSLERQGGEAFLMDLPPVAAAPRERPPKGALTVVLPSADGTLDTRRVALRRPDGAVDYYEGARWADFLPLQVRDGIVQTLATRHIVQQVQTDDHSAPGPYRLQLAIDAFQAEYVQLGQAPVVRLHVLATLSDARRPSQVQNFDLTATHPAQADDLPAIQAAFRSAFEILQRDLMERLSGVVK